ncbi:MAG TPA: transglutaminase-like domain-containing protein [Pirellulaceae bacterium]|nr:transglutaminase-like domain-containing protein [Pirellulaceae bacterium]
MATRLLVAAALLLPLIGCGPQADPNPMRAPGATNSTSVDASGTVLSPGVPGVTRTATSGEPATSEPQTPYNTSFWETVQVQDDKVGFAHTRIHPEPAFDKDALVIESRQVVRLRRYDQETRQEISVTSTETRDGRLLHFQARVTSGAEVTRTNGAVRDGKLKLRTWIEDKPEGAEERDVDWPADATGMYGVNLSLIAKPLKARETRTIKSLMPIFNQIAETTLVAEGFESLRVLGESRQLLKIRRTDRLGERKVDSTVWMDENGEVLKTFMPLPPPGFSTVRTTEGQAVAESASAAFDLGRASVVQLNAPIPNSHGTQLVVYEAKAKSGVLEGLFPSDEVQQVMGRNPAAVMITVHAIRPDTPRAAPGVIRAAPGPASSNPSRLVQSDDPAVVELAQSVAPDETDPAKLAFALEKHVKATITEKNFSQALTSAAEVAKSREGDCTEHAVLLAALCRARKLPCDVVVGLVYAESLGGFGFHMWNEAWVGDRWVPLDATLGRGGIGAAHIKLATSPLAGDDSWNAFLPVFQVLGRLELRVAKVE